MSRLTEITLTEQQILSAYIHESQISFIPENLFISDIGKEFFEILLYLKENNYDLSKEHILKNSKNNVTAEIIDKVNDISYQVDKIKEYEKNLKTLYYTEYITNNLLKRITKETSRKGTKDIEAIKQLTSEIDEALLKISSDSNTLLTFPEYVQTHDETFYDRVNGILKQTSGCPWFDKLLPAKSLIPGLGILFGNPGSGKSTIVKYLIESRLIKKLPTLYLNTENSHTSVIDSFICSLCELEYYSVMGIDNSEEILEEYVINKYEEMKKRFEDNTSLLIETEQSFTINTLKDTVIKARKKLRLQDKTILFCAVDLLTQMEDMHNNKRGMNKADVIESMVNSLNTFGLKTNTFFLGVIQPRLLSSTKHKIDGLDDLEKFRPTLEIIKSSGSFEERSRLIFGIHNPLYQAQKYLINNPVIEAIDPVIEVQLLKSNNDSQVGQIIKYFHQGNMKRILPFIEEGGR